MINNLNKLDNDMERYRDRQLNDHLKFKSGPEDIDMVSCAICGHSFAKDDCVKNEEGYWECEKCSKL